MHRFESRYRGGDRRGAVDTARDGREIRGSEGEDGRACVKEGERRD